MFTVIYVRNNLHFNKNAFLKTILVKMCFDVYEFKKSLEKANLFFIQYQR